MRILVTGSSGYVGSRLLRKLVDKGHYVIALDRQPSSEPGGANTLFVTCDLLDTQTYQAHLKGVDIIVHLAAAKGDWGISKDEYYRDNLEATQALIAAGEASDVKNWLFYSTVSALGPSKQPLAEDAPRAPQNPYGASKADCEKAFDAYLLRVPDARLLTLRPSVVFGPDNPWNTNIFRLIDAIYRNRFLMIGRGDAIKTTSFIDNLIDATLFLMDRFDDYEPGRQHLYHYVDAPAIDTTTMVNQIYKMLDKNKPFISLPLFLAAPIALLGDGASALTGRDLPITSARIRKFCRSTSFAADKIREDGYVQRVGNVAALQATVDWYLDQEKK